MTEYNWDHIVGLEYVKRAIKVGFAGLHSVLFIGSQHSQARECLGFYQLVTGGQVTSRCVRPCPCGNWSDPRRVCHCEPDRVYLHVDEWEVWKYDLVIRVEPPTWDHVHRYLVGQKGESWSEARERVRSMTESWADKRLDGACMDLLKAYFNQVGLSLLEVDSVIEVARTIANLARKERIDPTHMAEALQYRYKPDWDKVRS